MLDSLTRQQQTQGLSTREERNANLRIALKAIAVSLKQLFETLKPFAMTKLDPSERTGVVKSATELQAAVKNLAQGVRGHCNALPQFHSQACQQLVILSQAFVAAVWNLHKAAEHIAGDALVEEAKEYSVRLPLSFSLSSPSLALYVSPSVSLLDFLCSFFSYSAASEG